MTSITLRKHLWKRKADHEWQTLAAPQLARSTRRAATKSHLAATRDAAELEGDPACYPDLESLLGALSNREVTGGAALALVTGFLDHHGILQADRKEVHVQEFNSDISTEELLQGARNFPGLLQIFERVLDRNLKAGFSSRTVEAAYGRNIASEEQSSPSSLSTNATTASSEDNSGFATPARRSYPASMSAKFQVSLGKTVSRADLPRLFGNEDQRWFASRKLDGIRCLILVSLQGQWICHRKSTCYRNTLTTFRSVTPPAPARLRVTSTSASIRRLRRAPHGCISSGPALHPHALAQRQRVHLARAPQGRSRISIDRLSFHPPALTQHDIR